MTLYKRGKYFWYDFHFAGQRIQESTKTTSKTLARKVYEKRRRELEEAYSGIKSDNRRNRVETVRRASDLYVQGYSVRRPKSIKQYMHYNISHLVFHLGTRLLGDIDENAIQSYQVARLKEGASGKTINEEVMTLLRIMGDQGDALRMKLKRGRNLRLDQRSDVGRCLTPDEEMSLLIGSHYPFATAILIALNTGMRDSEIRLLQWSQIDLEKRIITVGKSKSRAGEGRTIPINDDLYSGLESMHKPSPFVFPGRDGTKPTTSFKTGWQNLKKRTGVKCRFHDLRHTAITKLAESGAPDEVIMAMCGHVSRRMLTHYSHIRMEAKRKAVAAIQTTAEPRIRRIK